ncbi:MAG: adenylate/guanylate cyclase domain-containing protein [Pseudomonadota bacterium]
MEAPEVAEVRAAEIAFRRAEYASALLALRVRLVGIALLAVAIVLRTSGITLAYYLGMLALLGLTGCAYYLTTSRRAAGRRWVTPARVVIVAVDMALITVALVVPAPGVGDSWPAAMQLRLGNVGFLFVFLAFTALTYSPALALWAGVAAAAAWIGGVLWILLQPGSFTEGVGTLAALPREELFAVLLDRNYVSTIATGQEALLLLIAGGVMAAAVLRDRRIALRQIETARERTKLARYFSPDVAEELAQAPEGLSAMSRRNAAILFADIVGFTGHAERMTPEETIAFLREFHRRATAEVFNHRGTLNKFIGDEVMASFGALHGRPDAAADALECAVGIARRIQDWSEERVAAGLDPVKVGVGVHTGTVVLGNIGDERCLELALIGDAVNTASRLEASTRTHSAWVVASEAALEAAVAARPQVRPLAERFEALPPATLRGKRAKIACAALREV